MTSRKERGSIKQPDARPKSGFRRHGSVVSTAEVLQDQQEGTTVDHQPWNSVRNGMIASPHDPDGRPMKFTNGFTNSQTICKRVDIKEKKIVKELILATSVADVAVMLAHINGISPVVAENDEGLEQQILDDTSFQDLQEFRSWLHEASIDTLHWGMARTKSTASLFREIQNKISVLLLEPIDKFTYRVVRLLRAARVRLKQEFPGNRIRYLVEGSQELGETGQLRYRNMLLSSMMRYGENSFAAAKRSVGKEMQNINMVSGRCIPWRMITAKRDNPQVCVEDMESPSFPGLVTRYFFVTVDVKVDKKLPESDFCTVEYLPSMHIATKHYWKWRTAAEVNQILNGEIKQSKPSLPNSLEGDESLTLPSAKPVFYSLRDEDFEVLAEEKHSSPTGEGVVSEDDTMQEGENPPAAQNTSEYMPTSMIDYLAFDTLQRHMRLWAFTEEEIVEIKDYASSLTSREEFIERSVFLEKVAPRIKSMDILNLAALREQKLLDEHFTVLRKLFPGACRIRAKILHGGFSGSFVLQARGVYCDGKYGDPTVVKLDKRKSMRQEVERFRSLAPYMGDCAPGILCMDIDANSELETGGIQFELVGAAWTLPEFRGNSSTHLLCTFKSLFLYEAANEERIGRTDILRMLGKSTPSALRDGGKHKAVLNRSPSSPTSPFSPVTPDSAAYTEIASQAPDERLDDFSDDEDQQDDEMDPPKDTLNATEAYGHVPQVLKEVYGEILRKTTLSSRKIKACSLVQEYDLFTYIDRILDVKEADLGEADPAILPDYSKMDPSGEGQAILRQFRNTIDRKEYPYYVGLVHGDLNGMNVLIDSHNIVWVIDFAFSGEHHVLRDIAKLESCILFEYTTIYSENDYEAMRTIVDILLNVRDLRESLFHSKYDSSDPAALAAHDQDARARFAWEAIKQLRMYAANYCHDDPEPGQMLIAMFHFAVRALRFKDINDKRLAFYVATESAKRLLSIMRANKNSVKVAPSEDLESSPRQQESLNDNLSEEQIKYEMHRYFHDVRVRESFILDVITREPVNIAEQTVELEVIEGESRDKVIREAMDMEDLQSQKRLQKYLDALNGDVVNSEGASNLASLETQPHSRFTSALQVLGNPRNEGYRVLLGGAASGKSCLLRKILVSMAQDTDTQEQDIIPVLILVINLGRLMTERRLTLQHDLIDEYFVSVNGVGSARLAFFRKMRKEGNLCFLFDGLDEAGDHKPTIEKYLARLVGKEKRILISSRETGFNEIVFHKFQFLQVMPLTDKMQSQIVEMRLGSDHPRLLMIRTELRKAQYSEIVRNPLMLSLLISLLANAGSTAEKQKFTRSYLYQHAIAQLLHQSSMAKYGMRRGEDDKHIEQTLKILASTLSHDLLKTLAFTAHSMRIRDFGPEILNKVAETYTKDKVYSKSRYKGSEKEHAEVFDVVEIIQSSVLTGLCGLIATSKVSNPIKLVKEPSAASNRTSKTLYDKTSEVKDDDIESTSMAQSVRHVLRFVHLSFQEYLAGLFLVDHLQHALNSDKSENKASFRAAIIKAFRINPEKEDWGLLHDAWWQAVLGSMAGSMSENLFSAFVEVVLSWNDTTGTNVLLCGEMHAETEHADTESMNDSSPGSKVKRLIKDGFDAHIKEADLVEALTHPSRNLQLIALTEVHKLYDPRKAAQMIIHSERNPIFELPWYRRVAAAFALSHLSDAKKDEDIIDVLLELWSDDSPQVCRASVEAIAILRAENHRLVIEEVTRQLEDDVEAQNGLKLVSALHIQHPKVIEKVLYILARSSVNVDDAIEALHSLPLTEEFLYCLCHAISHSETLEIRMAAAQVYLLRCLPAKAVGGASVDETVETAFITWLEHPEPSFQIAAAQVIAKSSIKSFRLAQTLRNLQNQTSSISGDHSEIWNAAMRAICVTSHPIDKVVHEALQQGLSGKLSNTRADCLRELQQLLPKLGSRQQEKYGVILNEIILHDPDPSLSQQALVVQRQIPQTINSEYLETILSDSSCTAALRSEALQNFLDYNNNGEGKKVRKALSLMESWLSSASRGLASAALATYIRANDAESFLKALQLGIKNSWTDAFKILEAMEGHIVSFLSLFTRTQIDSLLQAFIDAYSSYNVEDRQSSSAFDSFSSLVLEAPASFCDILARLGDAGLTFSTPQVWLSNFKKSSDTKLQAAMANLLHPSIVNDLEEDIANIIKDSKSERRVRAALALAMHQNNLWQSVLVQNAMKAWIVDDDDAAQLAAVDVLLAIGDVGAPIVKLLPGLLHGKPLQLDKGIATRVYSSNRLRSDFTVRGLMPRKSTKARMRIAVLSHLKLRSEGRSRSFAATVHGKIALRDSLMQEVQDLILSPKFKLSEEELILWLRGTPHMQFLACEILRKVRKVEVETLKIASILFEMINFVDGSSTDLIQSEEKSQISENSQASKIETAGKQQRGSGNSTQQKDDLILEKSEPEPHEQNLGNIAFEALKYSFSRHVPWSENMERYLLEGRVPQLRAGVLISLDVSSLDVDKHSFTNIFTLIRSACLYDPDRSVRIAAVAAVIDWMKATLERNESMNKSLTMPVKNAITSISSVSASDEDSQPHQLVSEELSSNILRAEECLKDVFEVPDRDPMEIIEILSLVQTLSFHISSSIFIMLIELMHSCQNFDVRKQCASVLGSLPKIPLIAEQELLQLRAENWEAKGLWLDLLRKMRDRIGKRGKRGDKNRISDSQLMNFVGQFCNSNLCPQSPRTSDSSAEGRSPRSAGKRDTGFSQRLSSGFDQRLCYRFNRKEATLCVQMLKGFIDWKTCVDPVCLSSMFQVVESAVERGVMRPYELMLRFLLLNKHIRLDASIIMKLMLLGQADDEVLETERSRNFVRFFSQYQVKDYSEACDLVQLIGENGNIAALLFEPILNFLRRERAYRKPTKDTKPQAKLWAQIDELVQAKQTLEAAYLNKQMRFGFEIHDALAVSLDMLVLNGRSKIKEQRVREQALRDMRDAERDQARGVWFTPAQADLLLEHTRVPAHLAYQRSRLTSSVISIYLSSIPDEMVVERQALIFEILPEVNRRLHALGVPVELAVCNPEILDAKFDLITSRVGQDKEQPYEKRLALAKLCAPYMVCFVGDRYGDPIVSMKNRESIQMLERDHAFLSRPFTPHNALCYFRDAAFFHELSLHFTGLETSGIDEHNSLSARLDDSTIESQTKSDSARETGELNKQNSSMDEQDLAMLRRLKDRSQFEHAGAINLKSALEDEKDRIRKHAYVKSGVISLNSPVEISEDGVLMPASLHDFFTQLNDDIEAQILMEFPIRGRNRIGSVAPALFGNIDFGKRLPFDWSDERRIHEQYLWENSKLSRGENISGDVLPRCRRHIYYELKNLIEDDGSNDTQIRKERKAIKNKKLWRKDETLGNKVILVTSDRHQGKTTMLATFADWYRNHKPPSRLPVIYHACGASISSTDLVQTLLRVGVELLSFFENEMGDLQEWAPPLGRYLNLETVRAWWQRVLCHAAQLDWEAGQRRPIIIIDGLFESSDPALCPAEEFWKSILPDRFSRRCPPGISIILSASKDSVAQELALEDERQPYPYREFEIRPLDQEDRSALLKDSFGRYKIVPSASSLQSWLRSDEPLLPGHLETFVHYVLRQPGDHDSIIESIKGFPLGQTLNQSVKNSSLFPDNAEAIAEVPNDDDDCNSERHLEEYKEDMDTFNVSTESFGRFRHFPKSQAQCKEAQVLDKLVGPLELEFGHALCQTVLTCLALTGHMDESDLFEFCAQFTDSISAREWHRFCLRLSSLVFCVTVSAENDLFSRQRGSSSRSLHSVDSRNSRGPEPRRLSDVGSQEVNARRRSVHEAVEFKFPRHVSNPADLSMALKSEAHGVRVLRLKYEWIELDVLRRYYGEDIEDHAEIATFYGNLCQYWVSKLDVWHATSSLFPLAAHRASIIRKIVHYALNSDQILVYVKRTLLSRQTLVAMAAQSTWHDAVSGILRDFELAIRAVEEAGLGSSEEGQTCVLNLKHWHDRIEANTSEINEDPANILEFL